MHRTKRSARSDVERNCREGGRASETRDETRDSSKFLANVDKNGDLQANSALQQRQKQDN
jgi:hypothetical protein